MHKAKVETLYTSKASIFTLFHSDSISNITSKFVNKILNFSSYFLPFDPFLVIPFPIKFVFLKNMFGRLLI